MNEKNSHLCYWFYLFLFTFLSHNASAQNSSDPYQLNADIWNSIIVRATSEGYGGSGGYHCSSLPLPYCDTCPDSQKHRRLWFFGDQRLNSIDEENFRVKLNGQASQDSIHGNTVAITSHRNNATSQANATMRDYGARGSKSYDSWMPLFIDTSTLYDMDPLRIATLGYSGSGFTNQGAIANVLFTPFNPSAPDATYPVTQYNSDIIPIYEYCNPSSKISEYMTNKIDNDSSDFIYQRIAFYVYQSRQPGTVPIYRYFSADFNDILLSLIPDLEGNNPYGYQGRVLLGYVYPADSNITNAVPLTQYLNRTTVGGHHTYSTKPNDNGYNTALWPMHGIVIGNDLLHTFQPVLFRELPDGSQWENIEKNVVAVVRGVDRPYSQWGKTLQGNWNITPEQATFEHSNALIRWGHYFMKDDNYVCNKIVYIYGVKDSRNISGDHSLFSQLMVARVAVNSVDDILTLSNWQYYSNGQWTENEDEATAIFDNPGPGFTIDKSPNGRYVITTAGVFFEPIIYFASSTSPAGPFTSTTSFDLKTYINEMDEYQDYTYHTATAHGGLSSDGEQGGLLISYFRSKNCRAAPDPALCRKEAVEYDKFSVDIPRFVNLRWDEIDP